jgi:hypothetical protein
MRIVPIVLAALLTGAAAAGQQPAGPPPVAPGQTVPPATQPTPTVPPDTVSPDTAAPVVPPPTVPATVLPSRRFTSPSGMIVSAVRPERAVDFEMVMGYLEDALAKTTDPTLRAQAQGWQILKATEPGPNSTVLYVFVIDPTVAGADYSLGPILSSAYPDRIQEIWKLYTGSLVNQSLVNLSPLPPQPAMPLPPAAFPAPVAAPTRPPPPPATATP